MKFLINKKVSLGLALALLILSSITILTYQSARQLIDNSNQVTHTLKVMGSIEELLSLLKDVETGGRGYVITGQERYLEPYQKALLSIDKKLAELRELTADNAAQQQQLAKLTPLISAKLNVTREMAELRRSNEIKVAAEKFETLNGKQIMDEIRDVMAVMKQHETERLESRSRHSNQVAGRTIPIIGAGCLLAISLTIFSILLINRDELERHTEAEIRQKAFEELELHVADRTAELSKTNAQLLAEIEERRQIERTLAEERTLLARRVDERTSDLSAANAELARTGRLKDEFLAGMSHELRTPLNAILGLSEALQEGVYGNLNEKQARSLHNIEESGRHLLSLINDILDLTKIGAGKLELEISAIPVESVCQASLRLVREAAQKKHLKISTSFDSSVEVIHADARRLKQILVNLLSNAVKFTADGGAIGLEVLADHPSQVVSFTVWDSGIGISQKDMNQLFKPFVQLDSSLARQHNGSGLGLALVYRMTEMHGGSVSIESEPGKGSRFTVLLPYQPELTGTEQVGEPELAVKLPKDLKIKRVLIVEDSPTAASQLERYFKELNIATAVHNNSEGVIERVFDYQPDLIVLDLLLPEPSGWSILTKLKAEAGTEKIPVIIISVIDEREQGMVTGASEYLVKPISRQSLYDVLQKLSNGALPVAKPVEVAPVGPLDPSQPLILLAEDNELNISTISDYLTVKGYRLIIARNGIEAVERARQEHPALILMDIQMPLMDGLEAIGRLRADPATTATPIIALTALAMPGDRERCLRVGANDYLSKPISLSGLIKVINTYLSSEAVSIKS